MVHAAVSREWLAAVAMLLAVGPAVAAAERPRVLVTTARLKPASRVVAISGDIQARYQSDTSFRVGGRIAERLVEVGSHVTSEQVLARLEPDQQRQDLRDAEAALASARATFEQAKLTFGRQAELMKNQFTTQPAYDQAEEQQRVAQSQVESAEAKLASAREQLGYTELRAGAAGIITARHAEVGRVVRAGDAVFTIARDGDRDAVFSVYEGLLARPPRSDRIEVALTADPSVRAEATIREISPLVDSRTGAVTVKTTLASVPDHMTLGAPVTGTGELDEGDAVMLPWSSLFRWRGGAAVWIYDAKTGTVAVRGVLINSYAGTSLVLRSGVQDGEKVVVTGLQFLTPGRPVDAAGSD